MQGLEMAGKQLRMALSYCNMAVFILSLAFVAKSDRWLSRERC